MSDAGFDSLLNIDDVSAIDLFELDKLSTAELEAIQSESASIKLSEDARNIFQKLRVFLTNKSIYISDRRWRKALKILQVSVYTNNKKIIDKWDCLLLTHFMWQNPISLRI